MRLLHTADWHLGRLFHNVSLLEDQRFVLNQLVEIVDRDAVDAVLVAGDVYDRAIPPAGAVTLLDDILYELCEKRGLPVIMISGNHDSAERLRFGARHLKKAGLHILSDLARCDEPVTLTKGDVTLDVFGIPYADPEHVRSHFKCDVRDFDSAHRFLLERIEGARRWGTPALLMSHCFVDGGSASDSERPLNLGGAESVAWEPMEGFDYVALGHLHGPQYRGGEHIRYSGSLLKYSFSEARQRKGVTLLDVDGEGRVSFEHRALTPKREVRVLEGELEQLLSAARAEDDARRDDYVLVRLSDRHAILDPMGKLRAVYPNVLHLEKPGMLEARGAQKLDREKLDFSALDMFSDFFEQASGEAMSDDQQALMRDLISELTKTEATS